MNIKKLNETLYNLLKEDKEDMETILWNRYPLYHGKESIPNENVTIYDFGFIGFSELSDIAFEKLYSHTEEINGVEKDLGNGIVFYTYGDNLGDREDGYIDARIEVKDGVELTLEILDEFDKFQENVYRQYIKLAGYPNTDGDIYDIAPVKVDFVIEKDDNIDYEDVLAVFPEINEGNNRCQCYRHVGQHGTASFDYYKSLPKATKEQYMPLYTELVNQIGYNFNVMNEDF